MDNITRQINTAGVRAHVYQDDQWSALAQKLREHGLTDVRWYPLTFGIATLYVGTKPGG